jgi:two-component system, OmpR family, copper resistance phosphate regulon response regulator CusR
MAKILVIDDDIQLLQYMLKVISSEGHLVEVAKDGVEGLELLGQNKFDLFITDMIMPMIDGTKILMSDTVKELDIKIICMSGGGRYLDPKDALLFARDFGADKILNKPFTKSELLTTIGVVLGQ